MRTHLAPVLALAAFVVATSPVSSTMSATDVTRAVYRLDTFGPLDIGAQHAGSAFVLCGNPRVAITARHVLDGMYADSALLIGVRDTIRVRGLLAEHVGNDVTVLAIEGGGSACVTPAGHTPRPQDSLRVIGWPEAAAPRSVSGVFTRLIRKPSGSTLLEGTAVLPHGASGGVMLTAAGEVAGVIHGLNRHDRSLGYATPLSVPADAASRPIRSLRGVYGRERTSAMSPIVISGMR